MQTLVLVVVVVAVVVVALAAALGLLHAGSSISSSCSRISRWLDLLHAVVVFETVVKVAVETKTARSVSSSCIIVVVVVVASAAVLDPLRVVIVFESDSCMPSSVAFV